MSLSEQPFYPYPRDPLRRFGFIVGDLIAWSIIILIAYIALNPSCIFRTGRWSLVGAHRSFGVVVVVGIVGAIWFDKRNPPPPEAK